MENPSEDQLSTQATTDPKSSSIPESENHLLLHSTTVKPLKSVIVLTGIVLFCLVLLIVSKKFFPVHKAAVLPPPSSSALGYENIVSESECSALKYTNQTKLDLSRTLPVSAAAKQDILLRMHDDATFKEIIKSPQNTFNFDYHPESKLIAYAVGKGVYDDPTGSNSVHLYNLQDSTDQEIFTYQTSKIDETTYAGVDFDALRGFSITDDGQKVIITSNAKIWMYDIAAKATKQVYSNQERAATSVFRDPLLSPDKSKIILTVGHSEGSSSAVLDLTTSTLIELPFSDYVVGERPLTWDGNDIIFIKRTEKETAFCWSDWKGEEKKCGLKLPFNAVGAGIDKSKNVVISNWEDEPSGQYVCNNVNSKYEVGTYKHYLLFGNVETDASSKIFEVDATRTSGVEQEYGIYTFALIPVNGLERVVAKVLVKGEMKYFAIDPLNPDEYQVIQFE